MDTEILAYAMKIIHDRMVYFRKFDNMPNAAQVLKGESAAYHNCFDILQYAMNGDIEKLKEFDYYGEED